MEYIKRTLINQVILGCGLVICFTQAAYGSDISGIYSSKVTGKHSNSAWFWSGRHKKLKLKMRQDGIWVLATNEKFEAKFSGTRTWLYYPFELEPTTISGFHSIIGEWEITSNGSKLEGSWKVAKGTGFQDANGKWVLTRIDDLPSGENASNWSNEYFLSELVLVDSKGNTKPYTDSVGDLPVADSGQQDLPSKAEKIKSLPSNLAWLEHYDTNQNGKIDKNEMCHAWLIKLAELKTKNTFSPGQLRIASQSDTSSKKGFCIPLVQREGCLRSSRASPQIRNKRRRYRASLEITGWSFFTHHFIW